MIMEWHPNDNPTLAKASVIPEVLCAVLLRELLWLEARMDVQALLEGSVVLSDEDGPV